MMIYDNYGLVNASRVNLPTEWAKVVNRGRQPVDSDILLISNHGGGD